MAAFDENDLVVYRLLRDSADEANEKYKARFYNLRNFAMEKHDTGDDEGIVSEGIGAFGRRIIKVIEEWRLMDLYPYFGRKQFNQGTPRASDFFAGQGDLSKAIWLLCAYVPRREFQRFRKNWPDKAKLYVAAVDGLLCRLHGELESLYPPLMFIRPFAHLRFLLRLHDEWLWEAEGGEPGIFKIMAYLANLSLDECSRLMRGYENDVDRSYTDKAVDELLKKQRRRLDEPAPNSRTAVVEEHLLTVRYNQDPKVRCLELSSVLLQYACCMIVEYLKEGRSFYSRMQIEMPRQRLSELFDSCAVVRHSLRFMTDCFGKAYPFIKTPVQQLSAAHTAFVDLLERIELLNPPPSVLATLRDAELAANDYFRMIMVDCRRGSGHVDGVNDLSRNLSASLDGFSTSLRTFEYEQSSKVRDDGMTACNPAAINEIMRVTLSNEKKIDAIRNGQDAAARKLETIRKDVKVVKAEQDSPSHDSKRHGPPVKFPRMVDAAILLLKKWAKENPAPNSAIAAKQVFDEWEKREREGKLKRGNRYTSLKSFQVIVARKWMRTETRS